MAADVNATGLDHWTPLHFAANEGKQDVLDYLLERPDIEVEVSSAIGRTPLHLAAIRGYSQIARTLIYNFSNKNEKDLEENTPLHYASEFGHHEVIILLIKEAFADPMSKNKLGQGPSDISQNL